MPALERVIIPLSEYVARPQPFVELRAAYGTEFTREVITCHFAEDRIEQSRIASANTEAGVIVTPNIGWSVWMLVSYDKNA